MTREPEDDAMEETDVLELSLEDEAPEVVEDPPVDPPVEEAAPASGEADGELGQLQQELEDLRNRSVRTLADYENYRKRMQRERDQERRFAGFHLLQEFVEVVDNLERALAAEASADSLKVGVEMILKQMQEILQRAGVQRIAALGEPFDHDVHEAVGRREDVAVTEPTVEEEHQAGYMMHDRLLRPARVTVAMPVSEEGASPAPEETEEEAE